MSATVAEKIAAAGAGANQALQSGRLPLSPAALHQAINQAFVDTLHGTYLISAIGLLAVAVLVGFLFQRRQQVQETSAEAADERAMFDPTVLC